MTIHFHTLLYRIPTQISLYKDFEHVLTKQRKMFFNLYEIWYYDNQTLWGFLPIFHVTLCKSIYFVFSFFPRYQLTFSTFYKSPQKSVTVMTILIVCFIIFRLCTKFSVSMEMGFFFSSCFSIYMTHIFISHQIYTIKMI